MPSRLFIVRKDGTVFPVEVRVRAFRQGGNRLSVSLVRDITDRKRAEEERERLRQLEADLAHINRVSMMGELAASIAHEVNQPLSGIVSNGSACLRWLAGDAPNVEEAREAVRDIVRDGKRAGEVIARIRALTKRTAPPREKLDLNETIREVLALVGDEAKKNERDDPNAVCRGPFSCFRRSGAVAAGGAEPGHEWYRSDEQCRGTGARTGDHDPEH